MALRAVEWRAVRRAGLAVAVLLCAACTQLPVYTALPVAVRPSPNFGERRPNYVILHHTSNDSTERALATLTSPAREVSAHYLIARDGQIIYLVDELKRAWHAGDSYWAGNRDLNSASVGIEIQNPGHDLGYPEFNATQMAAVTALSQDIIARNAIPPTRVLAHSDVSPGRKIDPGEKFDWRALHASGVGHWVEPAPLDERDEGLATGASDPAIRRATELLARYGYGIVPSSNLDVAGAKVVRSFQLHFRPARSDGRLDRSTLQTLEALVAAL